MLNRLALASPTAPPTATIALPRRHCQSHCHVGTCSLNTPHSAQAPRWGTTGVDGGGALTTDGETLSFNLTLEEMRRVGEVRLACMDEDRFSDDDHIGTALLRLSEAPCAHGPLQLCPTVPRSLIPLAYGPRPPVRTAALLRAAARAPRRVLLHHHGALQGSARASSSRSGGPVERQQRRHRRAAVDAQPARVEPQRLQRRRATHGAHAGGDEVRAPRAQAAAAQR